MARHHSTAQHGIARRDAASGPPCAAPHGRRSITARRRIAPHRPAPPRPAPHGTTAPHLLSHRIASRRITQGFIILHGFIILQDFIILHGFIILQGFIPWDDDADVAMTAQTWRCTHTRTRTRTRTQARTRQTHAYVHRHVRNFLRHTNHSGLDRLVRAPSPAHARAHVHTHAPSSAPHVRTRVHS